MYRIIGSDEIPRRGGCWSYDVFASAHADLRRTELEFKLAAHQNAALSRAALHERRRAEEHERRGRHFELRQDAARAAFEVDDAEIEIALSFHWRGMPSYERMYAFAQGLVQGLEDMIAAGKPLFIVLDGDIAQSLGHILKDELEAWAKRYPDRLKVVHVVGETPDQPLPAGFQSTAEYTAEPGHGRPPVEWARWIVRFRATPPRERTLFF